MKEQRNCNYELRSESRTVEGYALVFDKESRDLGGFIEIIDPSSLDGVIEKSDILCLLNHNEDKGVLARSKFGVGSLSLLVDETGLKYRFEAPDTALGNELLEGLKYLRRITKFKELFDVSPVYKEAYPDTSVACRKMQELNTEELKEYYQNLREGL